MNDSVFMEEMCSRPVKTPKLDKKAIVEPKPSSTYARLKGWEPEKDEYIRQYLLFHCQFYETKGFGIEWEKFDYFFDLCDPYDGAPSLPSRTNKTNEEVIKELTQLAISNHNQENGTNIVLVEHVSANFRFTAYMAHWITFLALDMSCPRPVPKLYQAKVLRFCGVYQFPIFRVQPTHEEMMAAPVHVKTPFPMHYDLDKPPVVFRRARRGEDPVPGTPFVFTRDGGGEYDSDIESDDDEWIYE
ncbi:unnamed protein product [Microthlaspi erraticum]|uniref:Uncharacterized protein n=1 Tax=Microthlaspi erraticum TaxID=1685480 RepID=A0A6D2LPS1_9BRAS|nr:unnamed protein product [Microthlaspi erraticum]